MTPYHLRNVKSYGFQIWPVHLEGPSEQKPIKNFEKSSHKRIVQGLPKIFRAVHGLAKGKLVKVVSVYSYPTRQVPVCAFRVQTLLL